MGRSVAERSLAAKKAWRTRQRRKELPMNGKNGGKKATSLLKKLKQLSPQELLMMLKHVRSQIKTNGKKNK